MYNSSDTEGKEEHNKFSNLIINVLFGGWMSVKIEKVKLNKVGFIKYCKSNGFDYKEYMEYIEDEE